MTTITEENTYLCMQVAEIWTVLVWRSLHRVIIESRGFRDTVICVAVQHVTEDVNYSTMKTDVHTTQNNKIMSLWYWRKLIRNIIIIVMYFFSVMIIINITRLIYYLLFLNELFHSCVYVDIICIYKTSTAVLGCVQIDLRTFWLHINLRRTLIQWD